VMKQQRLHQAEVQVNRTVGWQQQLERVISTAQAVLSQHAMGIIRQASEDSRLATQAATEKLLNLATAKMASVTEEQCGLLRHSITQLQQQGEGELDATVADAYSNSSAGPIQVVLTLAKQQLELVSDPIYEENELKKRLAHVGDELAHRQVNVLKHAIKAAISGMQDKVSAFVTMAVEGYRTQLESVSAAQVLESKATLERLQQAQVPTPAEAGTAAADAAVAEVEQEVQDDLKNDPDEQERKLTEAVLAASREQIPDARMQV